MKDQRVPILVYHHVYPEDSGELKQAKRGRVSGNIGEKSFIRQMETIRDEGWNVVNTSRIVDWLTVDAELPEKAVVLHFDNGWLDTFSVSLPILSRFGFTATCFPITEALEAASGGRIASVRTHTEGVVSKPFMTWDQAGELLNAGWELGAHTHTHCKVAIKHGAEGDGGVIREAETSNNLFQKRLGFSPDHFAYPSGSRNTQTDVLLKTYYRSLRLWHPEFPIRWTYTNQATSPLAIDCQNIDLRVPYDSFKKVFQEVSPI